MVKGRLAQGIPMAGTLFCMGVPVIELRTIVIERLIRMFINVWLHIILNHQ